MAKLLLNDIIKKMKIFKTILQKRNFFMLGSFIAGFSLMAMELTASRIVAPIIGNSIYTWTSIIGIVLLGLATGAFIGGRMADRYQNNILLPTVVLSSAIFVFIINILSRNISWIFKLDNITTTSIFLSIFLFFIPSFLIGNIQPIILKKYIYDFNKMGTGYGLLSTTWTMGSILGVFTTGFILISYLGSSEIIFFLSMLLAFLALLFSVIEKNKKITLCVIFFIFISKAFFLFNLNNKTGNNVVYETETRYYHAIVADFYFPQIGDARGLFLDTDLHSIEFENPNNHVFYTNIDPIFKILNSKVSDILVIGGGAYTIPKNLSKTFLDSKVEVIEIDPIIKEIAKKYFNLNDYDIKTKIGDARYIMNKGNNKKYDLIYGDAYSSFISVPGHLLTYEWNNQIKNNLNTDGIYALNMISAISGDNSELFQSVFHTFKQTFENHIVLSFGRNLKEVQNVVIIGLNNNNQINIENLRKNLIDLEHAELANLIIDLDNIILNNKVKILTDNFYPTEKLMAATINNHFSRHYFFKKNIVLNN